MKNRILIILVSSVMLSLVISFSQNPSDDSIVKKKLLSQIETKNKFSYMSEIEYFNNEVSIKSEEVNKRIDEIRFIKDEQEWFIAYKSIIEEYSFILDQPETIYDYYTDDELDMLFRVVQAEAGDECSFEQKANVASIILNRINHKDFAKEMFDVLTKDQFQPISDGKYKEVTVSEKTILACEFVFMFGDTTDGCLFFDSNGKLNYEFVRNDGVHNLYRLK